MHTVHTSTEAFPLNFYMRPIADQSTIHSEDDLERVNLTLRAGGSNVDRQKQLKILFKACGLSADFLVDAESAGYGRNSLEGFLYDVGAEAVQRKMQRGRELRDVVVRQHMLHLHHNIRVTFTEGQASKEQCDALDKMLDSGILEQISKMSKPGACSPGVCVYGAQTFLHVTSQSKVGPLRSFDTLVHDDLQAKRQDVMR